ncbi:MAG: MFS transporter, partial [Chloroflexota bacterium]|nr:MFS transporter [Chloroflexota bacterium]
MTLVPNRAFLRLWSAETISLFGSQITLLAVPLTAVLTLHATPLEMGVLMAVGTAPTLLFGLVIGAWVDRVQRRPLMIAADLARAALLVTIPVASYAQLLHIGQLYIVEFLIGVCTIVFDVAYISLLPTLVPHEFLVSGNSRLEGSRALAGTAGPGLAGALVQLVTGPVAILGDALSFV